MTPNPFDMADLREFEVTLSRESNQSLNNLRKTPENFLGPNSNLVNLDALVSSQGSDRGKFSLSFMLNSIQTIIQKSSFVVLLRNRILTGFL